LDKIRPASQAVTLSDVVVCPFEWRQSGSFLIKGRRD